MTEIRSLADELRETIKGKSKSKPKAETQKEIPKKLALLLAEMREFKLEGRDKLLVRLDERTIYLMKQLKVSDGIDMNRLIAFCLKDFFHKNPAIIGHIKDNIKSIEL